MMDHKEKFSPRGILAEFVGENQNHSAMYKILHGEIQFVFISQEALLCNTAYRSMLLTSPYKKTPGGVGGR